MNFLAKARRLRQISYARLRGVSVPSLSLSLTHSAPEIDKIQRKF